jgi:hypothetical protein
MLVKRPNFNLIITKRPGGKDKKALGCKFKTFFL